METLFTYYGMVRIATAEQRSDVEWTLNKFKLFLEDGMDPSDALVEACNAEYNPI